MNTLCTVLLSWAVTLSGYPHPGECPEVQVEDRKFFVQNVCSGGPCRAVGWYPSEGHTVYVHERLDLDTNLVHKSILLHELVHYLQWLNGKPLETCEDFARAEREAYNVQRNFLVAHGNNYPVGVTISPNVACKTASSN
jgi:hypothetical protein